MIKQKDYTVGIYCRLSKDDNLPGESMSIGTQRSILMDYCEEHDYEIYDIYIDDGYSGLHFNRPDFQRMLEDIDKRRINMVITKDLSRLGRDYIMTGYYTEILFPSQGIRYVALTDNYDTENQENDIAPFKNILNDMYARDISRKVKNAKRQRSRNGCFIGPYAPYGYKKAETNRSQLIIDHGAAEIVKSIYELALMGLGDVRICRELKLREVLKPAAYRFQQGDLRFARYGNLPNNQNYEWSPATVRKILTERVYVGDMVNHKSEITNYKTKQKRVIPHEDQIIVLNTHEAIISREIFERVQQLRTQRDFPCSRDTHPLFQVYLYCRECGAKLSVAHRKLKYQEDDLYRCMRHLYQPKICTQTHSIYHNILYDFVLTELRVLARTLKRKHVNAQIIKYTDIDKLTPAVLSSVIERIDIGHILKGTDLRKEVSIHWKLK